MGDSGQPEADDASSHERGPQGRRMRAGLRRHGLYPAPGAIRELVRDQGLRFTEGNRVSFYETGRSALQAMLTAIETAEDYIHLETYILRSDATGWRFADALIDRANAGVAVSVLYDALGSLGIDGALIHSLRAAGADVVAFNPVRRFWWRGFPRRRDHRKILCVDGRVAFTGGLNIGDEYWGEDADHAGWRDTHLRLEGPVVRELDAVFLESWFRADGPALDWSAFLSDAPQAAGDVRCAVVPDGPVYHRRRMRDLLLAGLRSAGEEVWLASPYLAPGRRVLRVLAQTGARARVVLVLAGETDHPILRRAARHLIPRLLTTGVAVYEYQASVMHAKVALFDSAWAIVGTSNLDRQSFEHSYEVNVVIDGREPARILREMFLRDVAQSDRVDEAALAARPWWKRWRDRIAALVLRFI